MLTESKDSVGYRRKLDSLDEHYLSSRDKTYHLDSFYAFIRHHLIASTMPLFPRVIASDKFVMIYNVLSIPMAIIRLLLSPRNISSLSFGTDRLTNQGCCRYLSMVPSLSVSNVTFVYSNSNLNLPKSAIRFGGFAILAKVLGIVAAKFLRVGPSVFFKNMGFIKSEEWRRRYYEYIILQFIHRCLIQWLKPKRVVFVSGSFFSPLVNVAKLKSIPSYEIGHAIIWCNHPIYSINKIIGEDSSALYYIDTEDAPLMNRSLVTHKKVIKTNGRQRLEKQIQNAFNQNANYKNLEDLFAIGGLSRLLVLGQGGDLDDILLGQAKLIYNSSIINKKIKVRFRPHPAFPMNKSNGVVSFSKNTLLSKDLEWCTAILASHSMAAITAILNGKYIVITNSESADIFCSLGLGHRIIEAPF